MAEGRSGRYPRLKDVIESIEFKRPEGVCLEKHVNGIMQQMFRAYDIVMPPLWSMDDDNIKEVYERYSKNWNEEQRDAYRRILKGMTTLLLDHYHDDNVRILY